MYEEHGYHQKPKYAPPPPPQAEPPPLKVSPRPFGLRLGSNLVLFLAIMRFCNRLETDSPLLLGIQFTSAFILLVIALGLITQRRWAVRLFLLVCLWSIVSSVVVTVIRISYLDQIEILSLRDLVLLSLLSDLISNLLVYGGLGILFTFNLPHFQSAGTNRYGNIPFAVLFGILVLFTAVQIADARANVALRAELLEDNQNLFGN